MVWFYDKTNSISLTSTKFGKHFNLDHKHGKLSKQTVLWLVTKFLKNGSDGLCWVFLTVVDRKLGDQRLTLMHLDQQY